MERGNIYVALILIISFVSKAYSTNRIFTIGLIYGHSSGNDAIIDTVINKTSGFNNISIILKKYNTSENINLFEQASFILQQNVVALIEGSHTKTSACALSEVTGVPLIRLLGDTRPFECEESIQMSAGYRDYAHASLDILNKFGWKNIVLVFDEGSLHEAAYFRAISRSSKLAVDLVHFPELSENEDSTAPVLRALEEIRKYKADIILLYINKGSVELMLQQKPCQHSNVYKWIIQGEEPMNISCHRDNIVLALKLPYIPSSPPFELTNALKSTSKDLIGLVYDAVQVINQAINSEPCLSINGSSIISKNKEAMLTCMKKVSTVGVTGPIRFNGYGKRAGIELEILNLRNSSFKNVGTWNSTKGAVLFDNISRNLHNPSTGESLEGRKFRVVVAETAPFVMSKTHEDGSVTYEGYCIDLLNELARNLKFTYEIYPTPDGMYGAETENGTWNGMIGELLNKRADMIVADLTITERREKVVDFSVPYMYYTEEMLLEKTSSSETTDLLQFMNPFDNHVWFATLASLVVISIAVFLINYFSPYGYKDENGQGTSEEFTFFNSVWFALACMLQQGADNSPRSLSGRILTGCYWFCILISVSTYTANLAAFFTVKNAELPINNLEDIVKSSYQVGVVESSSTYEAFKTSQYETYKKIWHRIQTEGTIVESASQGIQWVRDREEFVFIIDGPTLRYAANQPPCDLTVVPGLTTAKGLALALQAHDPHTIDFTLAILHLHENYFLDNLKRKWWENNNGCPQEQETTLSRKRIGLMSMLGVYVVLGVGIVIAFLTLIGEILWKRREKLKLLTMTKRPKLGSVQVRPTQ
ncbi:glutamate receptor ionotropic, kainate 2-like isoform X2 [Oculina patagonica]